MQIEKKYNESVRRDDMKVEIKINEKCQETTLTIETKEMTDEIQEIIKKVSGVQPKILSGEKEGKVEILDPSEILYISSGNGKIFAKMKDGEYRLSYRLYELEEMLQEKGFARISNSEIVNLKKVKNFDLSFSATICVKISDGGVLYVSRRYVRKIKEVLGRGGKNDERSN